jgi:hypothetical protein
MTTTDRGNANAGFGDYLHRFFSGGGKPRDFEQIVKVVLATFAVFTGFVFSGYLKDDLKLADFAGWLGWIVWFADWHFWAFVALMMLLLRYIMGSAVHLNFMYVPYKKDDGSMAPSRSQSRLLLFKDLMFLVAFGVIAMSIANAANQQTGAIAAFMQRAMLFVAAGFTWSLLDALLRKIWSQWRPTEAPGYFWLVWATLDAAQFCVTWLVLAKVTNEFCAMTILAGAYTLFLLLDLMAIVRAVQVHD